MMGNREELWKTKSLKLGAIRLKDLYLSRTPPTKSELAGLRTTVGEQLDRALASFKTNQIESLIATSGMAGNLAEIIHLQERGRPIPQLNLAIISRKELAGLESLLARSNLKARLAIPGLDPKRADTLLPAATVLRTLMELTEKEELTICDKAIREGLIYDFIQRHREGIRAEQEIPDIRKRTVIGLARRCHAPEVHALHVASLAIRLFDQTKPLHGFGQKEREWLEYAAMLHDIGYLINVRQHHKHAYYLIKNSDLAGLTAEEIEVIANIARYHRRALPNKKHPAFDTLPPGHKRTVRILAALLRIADALDRTHFSVVQTVNVKLGQVVTMTLQVTGDAELELWAARSRADLFAEVFHRRVQFIVVQQENGAA